MSTSVFSDKAVMPSESMLRAALAGAKALWDDLDAMITQSHKDVKKEWKCYSKKAGWSLLFKEQKRTLLYFVPQEGYFKVWFVFGDRAAQAAKQAALPKHVIEAIESAASHVEGRLFSVDVKETKDLHTVRMLLEIKVG